MIRLTFLFSFITVFSFAQIPVSVYEIFANNNYGWYEGKSEDYEVKIEDGKYHIQSPSSGLRIAVAPSLNLKKDYSFEASFLLKEGIEDGGIGLIFGYNDDDKYNSFTILSTGFFRIWCEDKKLKISDSWHETKLIKVGQPNKLKVMQRKGKLSFFINDKLVMETVNFPWYGKGIGFITYDKSDILIDDFVLCSSVKIPLPAETPVIGKRENLGSNINTKYAEISPKITADGKTLYFSRKHYPENLGGVDDREDIWISRTLDGQKWIKGVNMGKPVNTKLTNNLIAVSTDNNSLLFHVNGGFAFMHRTEDGWSEFENLGIQFKNETNYLEGCLSPDGKAIIFVARLQSNLYYTTTTDERDIYVCVKSEDGTWSAPIHTGKTINSRGDEYSPFMSADGRTLYFGSSGRPGYGDVDIYMTKRFGDGWTQWSEPVNLGIGVNTVHFDGYYTVEASGEYAYMVSQTNSYGKSDIIRIKLPKSIKSDPVILVSGKVVNINTQEPLEALIEFDDLTTGKQVGEARSDPKTGDFSIALTSGKNYGYHAAASGYLSVNENLELTDLREYTELKKDLLLVPIEVGQSIQLRNVFFVQSKSDLKPESYPELDRLVRIMNENGTMAIELAGHTDAFGDTEANLMLSEERVASVKKYLTEKGISTERIAGRGYGGAKPVAPNDTEENRQMNRRVEFKITRK